MSPDTLSLFDVETRGRTRRGGARTSADAAAGISRRIEDRILSAGLASWTPDEMAGVLDAYGPTVVSACSRLHEDGLIEPTGQSRPSARNRPATVWRLVSSSGEGNR